MMKTMLVVALMISLIINVFLYIKGFKASRNYELAVLKSDMNLSLRSGIINNLPKGTVLYVPKSNEMFVTDVGDNLIFKIYVRLPADHAELIEIDEETIRKNFDQTFSLIHLVKKSETETSRDGGDWE